MQCINELWVLHCRREILRDVRGQLRDAQESAASRNRLVEKRGIQLGGTRIELEQLQKENEKLRDELRNASRTQKRSLEQAKETVARLQHELYSNGVPSALAVW